MSVLGSPANGRIRALFRIILGLFLALFLYIAYLQTIAADGTAGRSENTRTAFEEFESPRGSILSSDGAVLAESVADGQGGFVRRYPLGSVAAHLVGYDSFRFGSTGIERARSAILSGISGGRLFDKLLRLAVPGDDSGRDVVLTIDSVLQQLAAELLGSRNGAVVMLRIDDGAILAAHSYPSFNPEHIDTELPNLRERTDAPLLNRAFQGLYTPGSTFKVITTASALDSGVATPDSTLSSPPVLTIEGGDITNHRRENCGELSISEAFARSCNTAFAALGVEVGENNLFETARSFGFEKSIIDVLPANPSRLPAGGVEDDLDLGWTSAGQGRTLASPLQMAIVAAVVAGDGRLASPRLIQSDFRGANSLIDRAVIPSEIAKELQKMMERVVASGTGQAASVPGIRVAGKTGTAELADAADHAWFIGYAPATAPQVAVAVIVENGGSGGAVAAPIAGKLLEAAISR